VGNADRKGLSSAGKAALATRLENFPPPAAHRVTTLTDRAASGEPRGEKNASDIATRDRETHRDVTALGGECCC